jgi:hypothetical protein
MMINRDLKSLSENLSHPFRVLNDFFHRNGGLRFAPTTGHQLAALWTADIFLNRNRCLEGDHSRLDKKAGWLTPTGRCETGTLPF